jgi:hypothetical protein
VITRHYTACHFLRQRTCSGRLSGCFARREATIFIQWLTPPRCPAQLLYSDQARQLYGHLPQQQQQQQHQAS